MQKRKLRLDDLKVQSFVTELQPEIAHTAKGGDDSSASVCITVSGASGCFSSICIASKHCTPAPGGSGSGSSTKPATQPPA